MNRALSDLQSYYCMVNCHLLHYDVCQFIEKRLNNFHGKEVKDYGLAFIYDEESTGARIVAILDRYLIKQHPILPEQSLSKFVKNMLTVPKIAKAACCVDHER